MIPSNRSRALLRLAALLAAAPVMAQVLAAAPACAAAAPAFQPTRFSVEVRGQGADVILIPGLASPRQVWAETAARLEKTHRVHLVQVAGFAGQQPGPNASGPVLAPLVEELHRYVADNRLKAPAVVGHSLGGLAGLLLAQRHPTDLGRLLIVDSFPYLPAAFNPSATVGTVEPQAAAMREAIIAQPPEGFAAMQRANAVRMSVSPATQEQVVQWSVASDRSAMARAIYDAMTTDSRPGLAGVGIPVQVIYPYDAAMGMPPAAIDALYAAQYAALSGVELKRIDQARHFVMLDQPAAFAAEVDAFLK